MDSMTNTRSGSAGRFSDAVLELLDGHGVLVAVWRPDAELVRANRAYAALLNLHPKQLVGRSFLEPFHADAHDTILDGLKNLKPALPARRTMRRFIGASGVSYWHEWSDRGLFSADGNLECVVSVGLILDSVGADPDGESLRIRQRTQHVFNMITAPPERDEDLLLHALEGMVEVTSSTGGYLHTFDPDSQEIRLVAWSHGVLKVCGATPGVHYPLEKAGIWADAIRTGAPVIHNDYPNHPDRKGLPEGHFVLQRHMAVPIWDEGRPAAIAGVGNKTEPYSEDDVRQLTLYLESAWQILKRREAEARLRRAQKLEAVGQLASGVAHNFNNILAIIRLNTDLLADIVGDPPSAEGRELLQDIETAVARGEDTVRQLLGLSREGSVLTMARLDLGSLVRDSAKLLRRLLPATIRVEADVPAEAHFVLGDEGAIGHVLINLANNARDAMEGEGELILRLRRKAAPGAETDQVVLEVADTGAGMPPETVERATDPFFTTKQRGAGTGLGLSMASGVAERHGGTLEIHSTDGVGTTVILTFPGLAEGQTAARPEIEEGVRESEPGAGIILVVDDEADLARAATRVLRRRGMETVTAESATEAMELMEEGLRPDTVLTDLVMPGPSGAELARWVRHRFPNTRVVIMSGHSREEYHDLLAQTGPEVSFLAKPWEVSTLLDLLTEKGERASG